MVDSTYPAEWLAESLFPSFHLALDSTKSDETGKISKPNHQWRHNLPPALAEALPVRGCEGGWIVVRKTACVTSTATNTPGSTHAHPRLSPSAPRWAVWRPTRCRAWRAGAAESITSEPQLWQRLVFPSQGQPGSPGRATTAQGPCHAPPPHGSLAKRRSKGQAAHCPVGVVSGGDEYPIGIDTWRLGEVSPLGRAPRPTPQLRRAQGRLPLSHGLQRSRRCWSLMQERSRAGLCRSNDKTF